VQYSASRKPLQSIDGAYVINLSRRPDRLQRFMANSSFSRESVHVFDAFDGQALKWSSGIETLFGTNKFNDARGMIGCALSHFAIWRHIATTENEFHAIFEDDAIFVEDFVAQWNARHSYALPFDADLVYLGGVLESNREHYGSAVQPLNKLFARHRATNFFTHNLDAVPSGGADPAATAATQPATSTAFHYEAMGYVLSSKGAQKLVDFVISNQFKQSLDLTLVKFMHSSDFVYAAYPPLVDAPATIPELVLGRDSDSKKDTTPLPRQA